ncbi:MAG: hypothetical protein K0R88_1963 [Solirubrobacterales bacterium]|jgi:hypothetical protein|nr:hypothetical protein [Solirubrobacterales bacterium]
MYQDRQSVDDLDVKSDVGIRDVKFAMAGIIFIVGIAILMAIIF